MPRNHNSEKVLQTLTIYSFTFIIDNEANLTHLRTVVIQKKAYQYRIFGSRDPSPSTG